MGVNGLNTSDDRDPGSGLFKDMIKYLPAQIIPGLVGFISIPIITRLFPPDDYGNYSLVLATVMILTTLMDWLTMSIIRFFPAAQQENQLPFFYGHVVKPMVFSLLGIVIGFSMLFVLFSRHLTPALRSLFPLGIGVFLFLSIFNVCQYFL